MGFSVGRPGSGYGPFTFYLWAVCSASLGLSFLNYGRELIMTVFPVLWKCLLIMMVATDLTHAVLWISVHLLVTFAVISSPSESRCVLCPRVMGRLVSKCALITVIICFPSTGKMSELDKTRRNCGPQFPHFTGGGSQFRVEMTCWGRGAALRPGHIPWLWMPLCRGYRLTQQQGSLGRTRWALLWIEGQADRYMGLERTVLSQSQWLELGGTKSLSSSCLCVQGRTSLWETRDQVLWVNWVISLNVQVWLWLGAPCWRCISQAFSELPPYEMHGTHQRVNKDPLP